MPKKRSCCYWYPDLQQGVLDKVYGDALHCIGHMQDNQWRIYPEELYYFTQQGYLDVYLTTKESTKIHTAEEVLHYFITTCHFPIEIFLGYGHLMQRGYIAQRDNEGQCPTIDWKENLGERIGWKVYSKTTHFHKNSPGEMEMYVYLCRYEDPIPPLGEWKMWMESWEMKQIQFMIFDCMGQIQRMAVQDGQFCSPLEEHETKKSSKKENETKKEELKIQ